MLTESDVVLAEETAQLLSDKVSLAHDPDVRAALQESADRWFEVAQLGRQASGSQDS